MKITNKLYLEKSVHGFKLTEYGFTKPKSIHKEPRFVVVNTLEFGTVYQALQHIVKADYDIEQPLREQIENNISLIDKAMEQIKKNFRTEVRTTKC